MKIYLVIFITLIFLHTSCKKSEESPDPSVVAVVSNRETEVSLFDNEIVLDGSKSIGEIGSYKWELLEAPPAYEIYDGSYDYNYNDFFPNEPTLSFNLRQVGRYTFRLTVAHEIDFTLNTSSVEYTFEVVNIEPDYTFSNVFIEPFNNLNDWNISNYSLEEAFANNPYTPWPWPSDSSSGGSVSLANGSLIIDTGDFFYWKAKKNLPALGLSNSDNIKISIKTTGDWFGRHLYIEDPYRESMNKGANLNISLNNYQITFRNYENRNGILYRDQNFFARNIVNKNMYIYVINDGNELPKLTVICDNMNITERLILSEGDSEDAFSFTLYSKIKRNGYLDYSIEERTTVIETFKIETFQ